MFIPENAGASYFVTKPILGIMREDLRRQQEITPGWGECHLHSKFMGLHLQIQRFIAKKNMVTPARSLITLLKRQYSSLLL